MPSKTSSLLGLCVALHCSACSRSTVVPAPPAATASKAASASDAAGSAIADAGADGGAGSTINLGALPGRLTGAVFLPNEHVLLHIGKRLLYDWDPASRATPRRTEVARDGDDADPIVWLTSGASRFVVGRLDEKKKLTLELWDAESQTKLKPLVNTWRGDSPIGTTSADGSRFLLMSSVFRPPESSDNEFVTYDLADGALVHGTKLPTLRTERYMLSPLLSPTGKYFALSHPYFPLEVRSSDTGKVVLRTPDQGVHYGPLGLFVDETQFLNAAKSDAHQRLTDLTTGRVVRSLDLKTPGKDDFVSSPVISPDHKRVALAIRRATGAELVIWNLEDGASKTFAVPAEVCALYCIARWTSAKDLIAVTGDGTAPRSSTENLRIDVESGSTTRVRGMITHVAAGGFEVRSEAGARSVHVLTPRGARVELLDVDVDHPLRHEVSGEHLLIWREDMAKVISTDGALSELTTAKDTRAP